MSLTAAIEVPAGQTDARALQVKLRITNPAGRRIAILNPDMGVPSLAMNWPFSKEVYQTSLLISFGYLSMSVTDEAGKELPQQAIQTWATPVLRPKLDRRTHIVGRLADGSMGERNGLWPRRGPRGQQDERIIAAAGKIVGACGPARRSSDAASSDAEGRRAVPGPDSSRTGMPRASATARLRESISGIVNSAAMRVSVK